ncbi:ABC transporter substrate-binding protein [Ruegeria sp. TM1040]|jgi:iron(III) transport system substrate-binding protein|uniref:ABC transporter substrate-binding protein n=1 Tax=Rhodobacterales TaxID=204455 RepID=UPI0000462984|nr:ABC transporter substrate-binding protein [Ruegeria sp. TM1040]MDF9303999.1 ABC transporter substrate-binding protein [Tritonibacter mobilis]
MRKLVFSLGLIFSGLISLALAAPLQAFEIEDQISVGPADARRVLRVISTGDAEFFEPTLREFLSDLPDVRIVYTVASSGEMMKALDEDGFDADLAISIATDLQTKLVNDGQAQPYSSATTERLPAWARWRDHLFAFTQEPAAVVLSRKALEGLPMPQNRQDLIALIRDYPERFQDKVGTYDIRASGLGYLYATQDARTSETYWRLSEVMGSVGLRLYCCSSQMIDDVATGELAMVYNVLGSYAREKSNWDDVIVLLPQDYTVVALRTAFIPRDSQAPELAGLMIDHLIARGWQAAPGAFSVLDDDSWSDDAQALRRIRMGPGLLVYLDALKKAAFLEEWSSAVLR